MAKRRSKKRSSKKNSSAKIFVIAIIVLALLALAISYFLANMGSGNEEIINKSTVTEPVESNATPKHLLEGTWASYNDGAMLTIKGNTFSIEQPSVESTIVASGRIVIKNGEITFVYTNKESLCGIRPGVYRFEFIGEDVKFSKMEDSCDSRRNQIVATWFKV